MHKQHRLWVSIVWPPRVHSLNGNCKYMSQRTNERMSQWNVPNEHICQQISMEQKIVVHIPSSLYKCPLNPTRDGSLVPWPSHGAVVAVAVAC